MKPKWKDAPNWANWLACDSNGEWSWYEFEPYTAFSNSSYDSVGYWNVYGGKHMLASYSDYNIEWEYSLEERPEEDK